MSLGDELPPLTDMKKLSAFTAVLGVNRSTIYNWVVYGVKAPDGEVIKLRAWKLGEWSTTEGEVRDFIQRRTDAALGGHVPAPPTSAEIDRRAKKATDSLRKRGVKISSDEKPGDPKSSK